MIKNGGVSNFGNHASTIVFYILSFGLNVFFTALAAFHLAKIIGRLHPVSALLLLLGFLNLLVLASTFPRHISTVYSDIHDDLGIVLFVYEFILSVWFVVKQVNFVTIASLTVMILGSLIGLLSIVKVIHFLFIGQIAGAAGFGVLLVICFPNIIEELKVKGNQFGGDERT